MTSSSSLGSTRIICSLILIGILTRSARCAGGDQRRAKSATQRDAQPSDLPQSEPVGCANYDPHADIRYLSQGELYDFASTQLAPTISQIDGVGDVDVGGSSLPAVRVGLNPQALFNQGVSLDDVRTAIKQCQRA
ncbi:multidrug resistance protein [Escherichia coli]|uniref:Multidrug resistance protein n=1 Tax=Escherichia coli TaxID=562 RepID=A0A447XH59_ECOLX|nr:multidrug resistance protein [Escherichia coli]